MATKGMKKMLVEVTRQPHVGEILTGVVYSGTVEEQMLKTTEIIGVEKVTVTEADELYIIETQNSFYVAHLTL